MSITLDITGYTMGVDEARDTSEAINKKYINFGRITDQMKVINGIQYDRQIPIIGRMPMQGKKLAETCDRTSSSASIVLSEKKWEPKLFGDRTEICRAQFPALLKLFEDAAIRDDDFDISNASMSDFILFHLGKVIQQAYMRVAYFGDSDAKKTGDGGLFNGSVDLDLVNVTDGLFKQWFAEIPTSADNYVRIDRNYQMVDENGQNTETFSLTSQFNLEDDVAYNTFVSLYEKLPDEADMAASEGLQLQFHVTKALFNNWITYIESKSLASTVERLENGSSRYVFRGIPIVLHRDWSFYIKSLQTDVLNGQNVSYAPHRAYLGFKENNCLGTYNVNAIDSIDAFYDKTLKKLIIDYDARIDFKHLDPELAAFAY